MSSPINQPKQLIEINESKTRFERSLEQHQGLMRDSKELLHNTLQIFLSIRKESYKIKNKDNSDYAPEICGYCKGFGRSGAAECPACSGQRCVVIHQPPVKCPRCDGGGKPSSHDRTEFSSEICIICRGKGWIMAA